MINIWDKMERGSRRRASLIKEIYYIKEENTGRYGLRIDLFEENAKYIKEIKLKKIDFIRRSNNNNIVSWAILLKDINEYEIFSTFCNDLIGAAENTDNEIIMINVIMNRLDRWQKLFSQNLEKKFPLEKQMGLFSELYFINEYLINSIGEKFAINHWGGPDSDLQDFIFANSTLEVKSYLTNKSDAITISNVQQLTTPKEFLYLVALSLSRNNHGVDVYNLITEILEKIKDKADLTTVEMFDEKIANYGYNHLLHQDQLEKFMVDKVAFYKVTEEFPKILPSSLVEGVINLIYQIDLTRCEKFLIKPDDIRIEV